MLDVGRSQGLNGHQTVTVQPANFLRAFRTLPEASAMGLLVAESHPEIKIKSTLPRLSQVSFNFKYYWLLFLTFCLNFNAQSWARFILQQLSSETNPPKQHAEEHKPNNEVTATLLDDGTVAPESESVSEEHGSTISPITKLFGVEQEQTSKCTKCGTENSKTSPVFLSSLLLQDLEGMFLLINIFSK